MRKTLFAAVLLALLPVAAQAQTTIVQTLDPNTGAIVNSGNSTNQAIRVYCVGTDNCVAVKQDRGTFVFGTTPANIMGGVFDDSPPSALSQGMVGAARITASRALHVNPRKSDGSEWTSFPVTNTGTFATQATQQGVWNIGTLDSITNAVTVTGNIGITGTPAVSISGTPNVAITNTPSVTLSGSSAVLGTKTNNAAAPGATNFGALTVIANAVAPTVTEGNLVALSSDLTAAVRMNCVVGCGGGTGGTASSYGSAFPSQGTAAGFTDGSAVMRQASVFDVDTSGGTTFALLNNLVFRTAGTPVEAFTASNPGRVDVTGTTTQPVSLVSVPSHAVTNAGTFAVQVDGNLLTSSQLIDNMIAAVGDAHTGHGGAVVFGAVTTSAPSYTANTLNFLSLDLTGALRVNMVAGGGSGGTGQTDNVAFTFGSGSFTVGGGIYNSTRNALTSGNGGGFAITPKRAQYTTLETPLAVSAMDETAGAVKALIVGAGGTAATLSTDYTHSTTLGTVTSVAGPMNIFRASAAAPSTTGVADDEAVMGWALANGSQVVNLAAGSTLLTGTGTSLNVNETGTALTNSTTLATAVLTQGTTSASKTGFLSMANVTTGPPGYTTAQSSPLSMTIAGSLRVTNTTTDLVAGVDAYGATYTAAPLPLAVSTNLLSGLTLNTDSKAARIAVGLDNVMITRPFCNQEDCESSGPIDVSSGSSTLGFAAGSSGVKHSITSVVCTNPTTSTEVYIDIRDGVAGTVLDRIPCPPAGAIYNPPTPTVGFTPATGVYIDPSAASTGLSVSLHGFKTKL